MIIKSFSVRGHRKARIIGYRYAPNRKKQNSNPGTLGIFSFEDDGGVDFEVIVVDVEAAVVDEDVDEVVVDVLKYARIQNNTSLVYYEKTMAGCSYQILCFLRFLKDILDFWVNHCC